MCIRDSGRPAGGGLRRRQHRRAGAYHVQGGTRDPDGHAGCLLYPSDAADERSSVDLGGRRILKNKKK